MSDTYQDMIDARIRRARAANPYFNGKRCHECGTVAYDENAYENHLCRPEVMAVRAERKSRINEMANIIICDRCGQIATAKVAGGCAYEANAEADTERYALCPNCSRELYDFLHVPNKDVRAIMAPFEPDKERATEGPTQADTSRAAIQAEYGESDAPTGHHTRY